jgi:subtilisin family serine protease
VKRVVAGPALALAALVAAPALPAPAQAAAAAAAVRVIVVLDAAPAAARADRAALADAQVSRHGGAVRRVYRSALSGYAATVPADQVEALRAEPGVRSVEVDQLASHTGTQAPVPSWGLDRVDQRALPLTDSYTYDSGGARVATYIFDSGVRLTHTEFAGRMRTSPDFVDGDSSSEDCHGHGTHVAGTAAGTSFGIAKRAHLVAVRVLGCDGQGYYSDMIAAIDWINEDHQPGQAAVANASLAGGYSAALNEAVTNSVADGVVWVVAAANDNADACEYSPASAADAITVAATDSTDNRAWFSNYGACVDVFAPGVGITSAGLSSDTAVAPGWNGTSMAAPHVAGAAARYIVQHPTATAPEVSAALLASATAGLVTDAQSPNRLLYVSPGGVSVPGAPQNAQTTALNPNQSALFWEAPSTDGGAAVTGYQVHRNGRSTTGEGDYTSPVLGADRRSFNFGRLVPGATYTFDVVAINSQGRSQPAYATVTQPAGPPSAPVIGTAAPGAFGGQVQAKARWSAPASTGGTAITGYQVFAYRSTGAVAQSVVLARSAREFTMPLPSKGQWRFRVVAINAAGQSPLSGYSSYVTAR